MGFKPINVELDPTSPLVPSPFQGPPAAHDQFWSPPSPIVATRRSSPTPTEPRGALLRIAPKTQSRFHSKQSNQAAQSPHHPQPRPHRDLPPRSYNVRKQFRDILGKLKGPAKRRETIPSETLEEEEKDSSPKYIRLRHNSFARGCLELWKKRRDVKIFESYGRCKCVEGCEPTTCANAKSNLECSDMICRSVLNGKRCLNRRFAHLSELEEGSFCRLEVRPTPKRGHGLFAQGYIPADKFIIEYVGVVRHVHAKTESRGSGKYVLEYEDGFVVDANRRGNLARFVNHSCQPNCAAVRFLVEGRPRIALVSLRPIDPGAELTFDYGFVSDSGRDVPCYCGELQCRGVLNKRAQGDRASRNPRKRKSEADPPVMPVRGKKPRMDATSPGTTTTQGGRQRSFQRKAGPPEPHTSNPGGQAGVETQRASARSGPPVCQICRKPEPRQARRGNTSWVQCSSCGWLHIVCIPMTKPASEKLPESWRCSTCQHDKTGSAKQNATNHAENNVAGTRVKGNARNKSAVVVRKHRIVYTILDGSQKWYWNPKAELGAMTLEIFFQGVKNLLDLHAAPKQLTIRVEVDDTKAQVANFRLSCHDTKTFGHFKERLRNDMNNAVPRRKGQTGATKFELVISL